MNSRIFTLLATLSLTTSVAIASTTEQIKDFWFNGAEINRYALTQSRYGSEHPGHAEFIFVTEPFLTEAQVKHEYGPGPSTDVLKLNALRTFNTGIYSYRTMTSTFKPIDQVDFPHALKTATSVQDWCGQAFQQLNRTENGWHFELRSYFQAEGDQSATLSEAYLEDALWLQVRLDPTALPTKEFLAIPGSVYTRFAHKEIKTYQAIGSLQSNNKTSIYSITYPELSRTLQVEFDTEFPHIIREWQEVDPKGTTSAVLEDRIMNSYYWSENSPKDAYKREQLGLQPVVD